MSKPTAPPADPTISPITGKPRQRRGFAAMDPARRKEIARKGGGSVPPSKRSFARDRDLAAWAGKKGGEASKGGGRVRKEAQPPQAATGADHQDDDIAMS